MTDEQITLPPVVDRVVFQAELDELRIREKAHTREGSSIAAARRCLPMVEVDGGLELIGPDGPATLLDAFEGRRQLIAYYFMGIPAAPLPTSAKGARSSPRTSGNWPTSITATSPTRSSARAATSASALATPRSPTTRASATATSWAGTCPGTRPSPPSTRS